ncbi:MAG: DarT ssDNA thymidine ADP-ribosyltransferase family protein [Pseudomonadota bacterium]
MSIDDLIGVRDIPEVLHFTTNKGLLGVLDSKAIKSRQRLKDSQRLEYILKLNTPKVMDLAWIDYVNLSITRINSTLYDISSGRWHNNSDIWWCILSFRPEILTHSDVKFVTTNNIYPAARRGQGEPALDALFADEVLARYSKKMTRSLEMPVSVPTCEQAEVLYPGEFSTEFLQKIYVLTDEDQDDASAQLAATCHPVVDIIVDPKKFTNEY